jgi:probable HAF family extracellular repeat protein
LATCDAGCCFQVRLQHCNHEYFAMRISIIAKMHAVSFLLSVALLSTAVPSEAACPPAPCASLHELGTLGGPAIPEGFEPVLRRAVAASDNAVVTGFSMAPRNRVHAFRWTEQTLMQDLFPISTDGFRSATIGISRDGSVLAGNGGSPSSAFRWTSAAGMASLGNLGGGSAAAEAISRDGKVVVGASTLASGDRHAFRWAEGSMKDLGTLGGKTSQGRATSADGSVVVGESLLSANGALRPFRWTAATGRMTDLGTLGGDWSKVTDVSEDGSVVAGMAKVANGEVHVFRWTQASGRMADIGRFGRQNSHIAMNRDGTVIAGAGGTSGGSRLFRWTAATGVADLGTVGSSRLIVDVAGISADGSVVAGSLLASAAGNARRPFRWSQKSGMQDLNTLLAKAGVNLSGIELVSVTGISEDGKLIVGHGTFAGVKAVLYLARFEE